MTRMQRFLFGAALPGIVMLAVGLAVYGPSLSDNFVSWDDTSLIYGNTITKGLSVEHVGQAFTRYDPELYIPLTFVSWQADYQIGGLNPLPYHLGNLLLHVLSALLTLCVVRKLTGKNWMGWLAGLLFLVHPLNVEAVAWASARKDTLSAFFCLASLLCYLHYAPPSQPGRKRWYLYGAALLLFVAALLSKVSVVVLPLILVLADWLRRRPATADMAYDKLPFLAASGVFGIVALFGKKQVLAASGPLQTLLMACKSTAFYLQKIILPSGLTVIYPYVKPVTLSSPDFWLPMLLVAALLALLVWLAWRWREAAFCMAWFLLFLAPSFTNFAKDGELYYASDRYAYLAGIGMFLLAGLFIERLVGRAHDTRSRDTAAGTAVIGCVAVLGTFAVLSAMQTRIWRDSRALFEDVVAKQPDSVAAHLNLAIIDREAGRLDEALDQTRAAMAIRPRMEVYTNFANIYKLQGKTDLAKEQYKQAIAAFPHRPEPWMGLGIIAQEQGDDAGAEAAYKKAVELEPDYTAAYVNLGSLYEHSGRLADAEAALRHALDVNPSFADGWHSLGLVFEEEHDFAAAADAYRKALELDPAHPESMLRLAAAELSQGHNAEALTLLKAMLKKDPSDAGAKALINQMIKMGILGTPKAD